MEQKGDHVGNGRFPPRIRANRPLQRLQLHKRAFCRSSRGNSEAKRSLARASLTSRRGPAPPFQVSALARQSASLVREPVQHEYSQIAVYQLELLRSWLSAGRSQIGSRAVEMRTRKDGRKGPR
jgi:hypothetical protein